MTEIEELEQRIESIRAEMPNMTGRDRNTQRRMINELALKIFVLRRGD